MPESLYCKEAGGLLLEGSGSPLSASLPERMPCPALPLARIRSCRLFRRVFLTGLVTAIAASPALSRQLFVDANRGDDDRDGLNADSAWRTLQHAANEVRPGDTVWVHPGVYRGPVRLYAKGTPESPIVFRATEPGRNRVVVTNANWDVRSGKRAWNMEDASLGLYSIPFEWDMPARVLYDDLDLFPYTDVEHLRTFSTAENEPGPRHGYAWDAKSKRLYVRLHQGGRFGSQDPNQRLIAIAPPTGLQREGTLVGAPHHYCLGVLEPGNAHVVIDGFTFETPGVAGVYTEANHVTVRRCWFKGCRTGVGGNYQDQTTTDPTGSDYFSMRLDPAEQQRAAAHVTIEYCDYSQTPAFDDLVEVMSDHALRYARDIDRGVMWARKDPHGLPDQRYTYEIGIAARIGRNWTIRRNHIHDTFEGLSCHATWASIGLLVEENLFERLLDNAVETEDHSRDMIVRRNVVIDALEPFSFQPLRGEPWPGPALFEQNIIFNTPEYASLWLPPRPHLRGAFKIGIKTNTWERNPRLVGQKSPKEFHLTPPGIIFSHNTVVFPHGRLIDPQGDENIPIHGIKFYDNILATDYLASSDPAKPRFRSGHFEFAGNAVAPASSGMPGAGKIPAEQGGRLFPTLASLGLASDFRLEANSPLRGAATHTDKQTPAMPDIGALQPGDTWYPLEVGPLAGGSLGVER